MFCSPSKLTPSLLGFSNVDILLELQPHKPPASSLRTSATRLSPACLLSINRWTICNGILLPCDKLATPLAQCQLGSAPDPLIPWKGKAVTNNGWMILLLLMTLLGTGKEWQDRDRVAETSSKGPQVGFEPSAAAACTYTGYEHMYIV